MAQYSATFLLGFALLFLAWQFVSLRGPDTDFFPRWYALRELLLAGRNPYGAPVTAEIGAGTSLATAPENVRAAYGFVYPLPGALLVAPLALLPYEWAAALWLTAGVLALPAAAIAVLATSAPPPAHHPPDATANGPGGARGRPPAGLVVTAVLATLLSVPVVWNLALVQPGLAVPPLVAAALSLSSRRPALAGASLAAAAALKPQWVLLLAPCWIGFHAVRGSRAPAAHAACSRRFLLGAFAAAVALIGAATLLLPTWPLDALAAAATYARVGSMATTSPAVNILLGSALPDPVARALGAVAIAALTGWTLLGWLDRPDVGVVRSLVAGALAVPPAWETGAIMLLVPLAHALGRLPRRAATRGAIASIAITLAIAPLPLIAPWRSGALTALAYAALWAVAELRAARAGWR